MELGLMVVSSSPFGRKYSFDPVLFARGMMPSSCSDRFFMDATVILLALIGMSHQQNCADKSWLCTSTNDQLKQAPSFVQADSCLCIMQNSNPMSPTQYAQTCDTAGGFPSDIRSETENKMIAGFLDQIAANTGSTIYPIWIGLLKNAETIEFWNDQCTNTSVASGYTNFDGGKSSTISGAAYSMTSSGTWKGNTGDQSAGVVSGVCRKDQKPCGRGLCQSGSTCQASGNCFTCTCQPGYTGQYCNQQGGTVATVATGPAGTAGPALPTSPVIISTVGPLPNCSTSASGLDSFPHCMPDTIEVTCDDNFTEESYSCVTTTTATMQSETPSVFDQNQVAQTAPIVAQNQPEVVQTSPTLCCTANVSNPDTIATTCNPSTRQSCGSTAKPPAAQKKPPTAGCAGTWVQCNFFWVILGSFAIGTFLIAVCGLCCHYGWFCCPWQKDQVRPIEAS